MRLDIAMAIAVVVGTLTLVDLPSSVQANDPCKRTTFKTELVKNACQRGGQPAAKDAMKAFIKEKKIKDCNQCHAKLAPDYALKADGLDQFRKLGGK